MKHISLFSGIGGFDLAAEWMGWENKFHCEFEKNKQKDLKLNNLIKLLHQFLFAISITYCYK